jgi:hypothetical protein
MAFLEKRRKINFRLGGALGEDWVIGGKRTGGKPD